MNFKSWLAAYLKQNGKTDCIGDIAAMVVQEPSFPNFIHWDEYELYMTSREAPYENRQALHKAFNGWKGVS